MLATDRNPNNEHESAAAPASAAADRLGRARPLGLWAALVIGAAVLLVVVLHEDLPLPARLAVAVAILLIAAGDYARARLATRRAHELGERLEVAHDALSGSQVALVRQREGFDAELSARTDELGTKTAELEERNRHLSIANAVSFALAETMNDEAAIERAVRLIARLLGAAVAEVYLRGVEDADGSYQLISVDRVAQPPTSVGAEALRAVSDRGAPAISGDGGDLGPLAAREVDALGGFAVLQLSVNGRSLGAFAVSHRPDLTWSEAERQLLLLIAREASGAFEHLMLYRAALARAGREALLAEVARELNAEASPGGGIQRALRMTGSRLGLDHLAIVTFEGASRSPRIVADVAPDHEGARHAGGPAWRAALFAAPALVSDRLEPLVRGRRGEQPVSSALAAEGIHGIAIVPMLSPQSVPSASPRAGALVVAVSDTLALGSHDVDVLARMAAMLGPRLESNALMELQERRIRELAGLAAISQAVQSAPATERLLSDFARALQTLVPFERFYVGRLDESEALTGCSIVTSAGAVEWVAEPSLGSIERGWLSTHKTERWTRPTEGCWDCLTEREHHGLVVPLRPKGQMLGVATVTMTRPPQPNEVQFIEQAVAQLGVALDSLTLYRQATERAARIQVLSNLSRIVASAVDLREAFDSFAEEVRWLVAFERAVMLFVDEEHDRVSVYAQYPATAEPPSTEVPLVGSIAELVSRDEHSVTVGRFDPVHAPRDWSTFGTDATAVSAVPVLRGGRCVAVFALVHTSEAASTSADTTALEEVAGLLSVAVERAEVFEQSEYRSRHDELTGLPNHRYLQEELAAFDDAVTSDRPASALVIDLDELKTFNDTLGHAAGDQLIQAIATELRESCRSEDFVARSGGDEFVVLMRDTDTTTAVAVAERIQVATRELPLDIGGAPVHARLSIGVATAPTDAHNQVELLALADRAMYGAKFAGGGRTETARGGTGSEHPYAWTSRESRVVESLVRAALAGATESEREAVALAQRYATAMMLERNTAPSTIPVLRLLAAASAAPRVAGPLQTLERQTALLLLDGLQDAWDARSTDDAAFARRLLPASVEVAWLLQPVPAGEGLELPAALQRVRERGIGPLDEAELAELERVARSSGAMRRRGRAA